MMKSVECPKCGSSKVGVNPFLKILLISAVLLAWIPILGWVVSPLLLIIGLAFWLVKKVKKIQTMKCKECKHQFTIDQGVYMEYKQVGGLTK
jgi:transcription elongation factor Elf1